jgi:putative membrane protein
MSNTLKGLLAGAAGGVIGTWLMGMFMSQLPKLMGEDPEQAQQEALPKGDERLISIVGRQYEPKEPANEAAGRVAYEKLMGQSPDEQQKPVLGEMVHWGFGATMGALYGALRGEKSMPDFVGGMLFGTAVWLLASELMVPLLGLAPAPTETPLSGHATYMTSHLVYGAATAATAQALLELVPTPQG